MQINKSNNKEASFSASLLLSFLIFIAVLSVPVHAGALDITMTNPLNTTYYAESVWFNATINESASFCLAQAWDINMGNATYFTMTNSSGNWNYRYLAPGIGSFYFNAQIFCNNTTDIFNSSALNFTIINNGSYLGNTVDYCANSTFAVHNYTITGFTDMGTFVSQAFSETEFCSNGCSETFGNCRYDRITEIILLLAIITALVIFIYATRNIHVFSYVAITISALAAILVFITDVFSEDINTLLLITGFSFLIYGMFQGYKVYVREDKEDDDYVLKDY